MRRGGVWVVGLVLLVVGTVGCGPSTSASPTGSTSLTPTLSAPVPSPAKPLGWEDQGEDGAKAAAVWFLTDEYAYVVETNDVTEWQRLSTSDCQFCATVTSQAQEYAKDGYVGRAGRLTATVTRVQMLNPLAYSVVVDFYEPPATYYDTDGRAVMTSDLAQGQILLVLFRMGVDWQVREGQYFAAGVPIPTSSIPSASP